MSSAHMYVYIICILRDFFTHKVHVVTVCTCMELIVYTFTWYSFFFLFFFPLLLLLLFSPFSVLFLNAHFLDLCSYIALLYYTEYVYIITTGEHVSIVHTVHSYWYMYVSMYIVLYIPLTIICTYILCKPPPPVSCPPLKIITISLVITLTGGYVGYIHIYLPLIKPPKYGFQPKKKNCGRNALRDKVCI